MKLKQRASNSNQEQQLQMIKNELNTKHAELVIDALLNEQSRKEIKKIVERDYLHLFYIDDNDTDIAEHIVAEIIGTGIIERIIKDPTITDISYNGSHLIIESSDTKKIYDNPDQPITEEYIVRVIQKFANAVGKEFTPKSPIFDGVFGTIRINAVHGQNTVGSTTMSLRIVRPKLVLNEDNFETFAPKFMYDFFKVVVESRNNIAISGETGTGKTELLKLLFSFILFEHKGIMIEDVPESHVKQLFPNKDTLSWLTGNGVTMTDLIKAALRNNPRWINLSELRGKEAYEMIQAVLSGHHIMTTLHSVNAETIPKRLVNMAKIGYQVDEKSLEEDILRYFHFGVHIKRAAIKAIDRHGKQTNKIIRYLSKVVEFSPQGSHMVFEQKYRHGKFTYSTGHLSDEFHERLAEVNLSYNLPSYEDQVAIK